MFDILPAEHLGQQAESAAAPQVELEEAVAGRVEALRQEQVVLGFRIEVGDAPPVDEDLDGFGESGDFEVRDCSCVHRYVTAIIIGVLSWPGTPSRPGPWRSAHGRGSAGPPVCRVRAG